MSNLKKYIYKYWIYSALISISLTPVLWFVGKGRILINGVDTNFPLDPLVWISRRLFVWNDAVNGGIDFSSSVAGFFFHLIQAVPYYLGFGLTEVQIISLVFWFSLIVWSSYFLSRVLFPNKTFIQLLFVVLYMFNPYNFNTWENVKVANISLLTAIPAALAVVILIERKDLSWSKAAFLIALIGIVLSGSGINPAYFICFFIILFLFILAQIIQNWSIKYFFQKIKDFLLITIIIVGVNFFWILPTAGYILENIPSESSIYKIGFNNWVISLSENTSLFNVLRLQGAWDWYTIDSTTGESLYIPYANRYFHNLSFLLFSFLIPTLAFASFIFKNKENNFLYLSFGLMLIIGVFLGVGTHPPTGTFFLWFSDHIPFFSLFRSPWYIFTPLVIIAYCGLISLLFFNLSDRISKSRLTFKIALNGLILLFIIGNLIYSYPLLAGRIFRPTRSDGFYINFPDYIEETKKELKESVGVRTISYPDDEIEKFSWNYRGIESILGLFSRREVLFSPLNMTDAPIASINKEFYISLKKNQEESAKNIAYKLSIGEIFEKKDQPSLSPNLPDFVKKGDYVNFGQWNFYKFPANPNLKISIPENLLAFYPYKHGSKGVFLLNKEDVLLNPDDKVVNEIDNIKDMTGSIILTDNSQLNEFNNFINATPLLANRLLSQDVSKVVFSFKTIEAGSYQPILERYKLEDFNIDLSKGIEIELNGNKGLLDVESINNSYVIFKPIDLSTGDHQITIFLINPEISGGLIANGQNNFIKNGKGEFTVQEDANGSILTIFNKDDKDISALLNINKFDPMGYYLIQARYRQIYGNNAAILVNQSNNNTLVKAQVERLPNYPELGVFSFYFEPVKTSSRVQVGLVAPFTKDPLGTKIQYQEPKIYRIFANNLFMLQRKEQPLSVPKLEFKMISPVEYQGKVSGAIGSHAIVFSENYSPKWELIINGVNSPPHFSANLYANAWFLQNTPTDYVFKIYYSPQKLYIYGVVIGIGMLLLTLIMFLKTLKKF